MVELTTVTTLLAREGERTWNVRIVETEEALWLALEGRSYVLQKWRGLDIDNVSGRGTTSASAASDAPRSRMPGTVVKVVAKEGERIEAGQTLLVLDSMKTEHLITAPRAGVVKRLPYQPGDQVPAGAVLAELEG